MILDHEWLAAAAELVEHSPGILTSIGSIVLYALIRDGFPRFKRWRYERANGGNPGHNPGNSTLVARVVACETDMGEVKADVSEVKDFCARADERWKSQAEHNKRMDKHVEKIHTRIDGLAGLGKS